MYTLTAGPVLTNISKCQIETQTLSLRLKLWRKVYNSESPRPIFTNIVLYSDFSYRLTGFALCKVDFVKSRKSYPRTFTNCYWCNRPKSQNGCLFPHLNQIFANVKHLKITTTYVSTHILLCYVQNIISKLIWWEKKSKSSKPDINMQSGWWKHCGQTCNLRN